MEKLECFAGMKQRLFGIDEAAQYLGMSAVALRHKVAAGEIIVVKIDGKLRFDRRDLDRYIDQAPREGV
jgi:excisionase family DNA binding protein